jgi:hypothetical protein
MKTYLDCYPCFLRQALSAARRAGASTEQQRGIVLETMDRLKGMPEAATPPEMADGIHRLVRASTKNPDPYREAKKDATEQALALLPRLRELVRASADPLDTALRIAIAGNIIDDGARLSSSTLPARLRAHERHGDQRSRARPDDHELRAQHDAADRAHQRTDAGVWQRILHASRGGQILLGATLGATPGCLGAFTAASLYL